ncbi:MAG: hypothetical protein R3B84_01910 [Zavarzinella sp.]
MSSKTKILTLLCTLLMMNHAWSKSSEVIAQLPLNHCILHADIVATGKVIEIEKEEVELPVSPGNKEKKVAMKVAVIKIEQPLMGCKGLTQLRLAFSTNNLLGSLDYTEGGDGLQLKQQFGGAPYRGIGMPALPKVGAEGIFVLNLHHTGDYYIYYPNAGSNAFIDSKIPDYKSQLETVLFSLKCLDNPLLLLKDEDKNVRYRATEIFLTKCRMRPPGKGSLQVFEKYLEIELNDLLLSTLLEMPWMSTDANQPTRQKLWWMIDPSKYGFKNPEIKAYVGAKPEDFQKIWDESTARFLKENLNKIHIKYYSVNK